MLTGFKVYKAYLALKAHFEREYDYFKYSGKIPCSVESYEKRKDRFKFESLAKKLDRENIDPVQFFVGVYIENGSFSWIGDFVDDFPTAKQHFVKWLGRKEAILYNFANDLSKIEDIKKSCIVLDGKEPQLLQLYKRKLINPETVVILDSLCHCIEYWDKQIKDTYTWPTVRTRLQKYAPFVQYEKASCKQKVLDHISKSN